MTHQVTLPRCSKLPAVLIIWTFLFSSRGKAADEISPAVFKHKKGNGALSGWRQELMNSVNVLQTWASKQWEKDLAASFFSTHTIGESSQQSCLCESSFRPRAAKLCRPNYNQGCVINLLRPARRRATNVLSTSKWPLRALWRMEEEEVSDGFTCGKHLKHASASLHLITCPCLTSRGRSVVFDEHRERISSSPSKPFTHG